MPPCLPRSGPHYESHCMLSVGGPFLMVGLLMRIHSRERDCDIWRPGRRHRILRAIVAIAQHDGQPCTARQISRITHVPAPYLSKLMQGLVRAGLAKSQRGLHGGFVLTKQSDEMRFGEIVDAVEPLRRIHEWPA